MLKSRQEVRNGKYYLYLLKTFSYYWFKLSDQRMFLGFLWNLLNPLITALVLYLIFRNSFGSQGYYYFVYILIGSICWNFLSSAVQSAIPVLIARGGMVKNIPFPKEILVTAKISVFLLRHLIEILLIVVLIATKQDISWHAMLLPVIFLIEGLLALSIAVLLSLANVYLRDLEYIWAVIVRIGFFLVPIFYQLDDLAKNLKILVVINPFTQVLIFYRNILIDHRFPNLVNLVSIIMLSLALLSLSLLIFRRFEKNMAERV